MAKKKTLRKTKEPLKVLELTIKLQDTNVWRKVLVHDFIELEELHIVIQASMNWDNKHLSSFEINGKSYSDEETAMETDGEDWTEILLKDVLRDAKKFQYIYDFGDDWNHEIEISSVLTHDSRMQYPVCIGGENACPPEDCGGPHGYQELLEILNGPDGEEKDERLAWVGGFFNPHTFDPNLVNHAFLWIGA